MRQNPIPKYFAIHFLHTRTNGSVQATPTLFSCAIMTIRGIKKDLLSLLLELGKNSHPKEFAALLKEEDGVISELNLLPGTITGSSSASIFFDMMPLGTHRAGSAHSHPNGVLRPSNADINFFPRAGKYHIIIGAPYRENDWLCFTADGEPCDIEVIP
ncbi:Mov34/MPN/PAD-1 family protein [Methanoregula sp.]|jgi:proteasome lid subunit RPN8/RPN11|uniref:Mov34/MPN/PAD-1 family protein n=1 Tax=Methanoregula sp. TaxID=2052170 RepID=UPI003C15C939